jgi:hypothetical protein
MRRNASHRSASASDSGIIISASAAASPPAASTIGSARLTPMIGTWPLRHTASAASFMRARLAARSAADLAPVPYGPPTMIHMENSSEGQSGWSVSSPVCRAVDRLAANAAGPLCGYRRGRLTRTGIGFSSIRGPNRNAMKALRKSKP